jgi:hypothetical protein
MSRGGMDPSEEVPAALEALVKPHVDSFDWFVEKGIQVRCPVREDGAAAAEAEPPDGEARANDTCSGACGHSRGSHYHTEWTRAYQRRRFRSPLHRRIHPAAAAAKRGAAR